MLKRAGRVQLLKPERTAAVTRNLIIKETRSHQRNPAAKNQPPPPKVKYKTQPHKKGNQRRVIRILSVFVVRGTLVITI